jgi:tetratricopeptide (TPR) repeat protein
MPLASGSTLGNYEILATIGSGGMGEVYRARDSRLGRDVAIKVLPSTLSQDPVARERLRREAIAAAALDHPFVCKVFEIGDADNLLFIVMELVSGETLHARMASGAVSLSEALAWAVEIAEALDTAHARQLVHRDLKPANVMVGAQGHVKVMDFGLAKNLSIDGDGATRTVAGDIAGPLTDKGMRVGTPGYMAPEQIVGDTIDGRTDIFALGVMLCEAVGGVHPFRRPTVAATTSAILGSDPLIAGQQSGEIPAPVRQILQRMMAKLPNERYQSMADVRRDLIGISSSNSTSMGQLGGTRWASADRIGQARRWPMVGRDSERTELIAKLDQAMTGRGGLVLIGGEPGIGKTRLTEAIQDEARSRGCMCLVGHSYEMEGAPPFVPFIEMLEYSARVVPPAALKHALGDAAPEVAKLMPELRQMFPDIPPALDVPAEQQRRLLFNAYRDFVDRSCRMAPILTVLEDLHWADDSTLQLLMHLAPSMAKQPLLVIGTYRDVELDVTRPFAKVLETLVRQRMATRIALRRLPAEGVSDLLTAMSGLPAPPSLSRIVFNETEGNPFFVEEVFQHLKEEGRLFDEHGRWRTDMRVETLDVPEGVRLVIGRRLERLSETSRKVLTTAAVIGRTFSLSLLESLDAAGREDEVLEAIEEAEQAHLVAAQRAGRETRYLFAHELIRQTLADALSMPRRQRLHAKIADAIERVYAGSLEKHASAMAHHLYQAGAASDPAKTTKYLLAAADEARAASAPEDALKFIDQALSLWDDNRGATIAELHDRRGRVLRSLSKPDEAIREFTLAVDAWDAVTHVDQLVLSASELAVTYLWQADLPPAERMVEQVLARLTHASAVQRLPLLLINAMLTTASGNSVAGIATLEEACAITRAANVPMLDLFALGAEVHCRWTIMDLAGADATSRKAVPLFEAAGQPWMASDIAYVQIFASCYRGRIPTDAELDEIDARAKRVGNTIALGINEVGRAYREWFRGDVAAAERMCREAAARSRLVQNRWGYFQTLFCGFLAFMQGRFDEGLAEIDEADRVEPPTYWFNQSRRVRLWALAHIAPEKAKALWVDLRQPPLDTSVPNPFGAWLNAAMGAAALALIGQRDEAASYARNIEALLDRGIVWAGWIGSAYQIAGIATGCAREWDVSDAHFRKALDFAANTPHRPEEAMARVSYADMLRHRDRPGDRERARTLCAEAESMASRIGLALIEQRARDLRNAI